MATSVTGLELRRLAEEASSLASVVRGSLGPQGGQVLLTRPTGEILLSRDGERVLRALNLDSPTARMMITCLSTHCNLVGDGAKTFIVLLSALLQEIEKLDKGSNAYFFKTHRERNKYKEKGYMMKQVSQFLSVFQVEILDPLVTQKLGKHFQTVFSASGTELNRTTVKLVLEAYFCGKVGYNRQKYMCQLAYNFFFKTTAEKDRNEVLPLVDKYFPELHTTVTGLPVSHSQILDGLVLLRDFAVYCPSDGDKKVLIITEPIHSSLSQLGTEVAISGESQYEASELWITKRTKALMKHLQDNNIGVLLSGIKQHEIVHYCAKNSGICIVECLSREEISLICKITNISPFQPSLDNICTEITETAIATFCQPLQIGTKRFVHINFARTCALQPCCVVFCGPVHGLNEQHACAFHGAFKMLQHLFTTIHLAECCNSKPQSQNFPNAVDNLQQYPAVQQRFVEMQIDCDSDEADTGELKHCEFKMKVLSESEDDLLALSQKYPKEDTASENAISEDDQFVCPGLKDKNSSSNVHGQQFNEEICIRSSHTVSIKCEENNKTDIHRHTNFCIKAGSVMPVGGIFEILLNYYLSCYAKQCQLPDISVLCTLVADVLLTVPKALCRTQKRSAFPQLYLEVTSALRNDQQLLPKQKYLESVSCKYQLIVSVLHCAATLLRIDLIIGIKRLPQTAEESNSDSDI
nr:PREDICTED: Bardet-Biedl syndrome 10 protein [Anolis carolinensis]|eukprot:XP_003219453.1 PREDICTED: Bardet-Biedl syndrome 10 protein [Anolis carolinensis]